MPQPTDWQCLNCSQMIDHHLDTCWHCGANKAGEIDPQFKPVVYDHSQRDQHDATCKRCGYMLRSLTVNRCPECGEEFDLTRVDTIPDADTTTQVPGDLHVRQLIYVWVSYVAITLAIFLLLHLINTVVLIHEDVLMFSQMAFWLGFLITPLMLLIIVYSKLRS